MKYRIYNNVEGEIVKETNSDAEFIHFVRNLAVENCDEELSILSTGEAKDYLSDYCSNLKLLS
jgi:hypothetical protein